jgi:hypothetical protein
MASKFSFLIIMLAFTVACGSSDDGGGSGPEPTVKIAGSVNITGDLTASGDFTRNAFTFQPSCAALAAEGHAPDDPGPEGGFEIPAPPIGTPLEPSGDVYASTMEIPAAVYDGPGTYVNDETITQIVRQIILVELPDGPSFFVEDGTATATIMADGSGSLVFEDVPQDPGQGGTLSISGTVTWTCSDE